MEEADGNLVFKKELKRAFVLNFIMYLRFSPLFVINASDAHSILKLSQINDLQDFMSFKKLGNILI